MSSSSSSCCGTITCIIVFLTLIICPCIFGWKITVLNDEINDIQNAGIVTATAFRSAATLMECGTKSTLSISARNVQVFNLTEDINVENLSLAYVGSDAKSKSCTCNTNTDVYLDALLKQKIIEQGVDCSKALVPSNTTVYLAADGSITYTKPELRIAKLKDDIGGNIVGICLCCGIIGFVLMTACLYAYLLPFVECMWSCCCYSRERVQVHPDKGGDLV